MKTEEEKKEIAEIFFSDLKELVLKHKAKHFSFCCELEDKYVAIINIDADGFGNFFEATLKVARLYQSCREKIKSIFNDFEK